jgi:hypothetical protein
MNTTNEHLDALKDIRNMMERSSRFVSLNGFAGVFVGVFALCGALAAHLFISAKYDHQEAPYYIHSVGADGQLDMSFMQFFFLDAVSVLLLSVLAGTLLSIRKARKERAKIWDKTARRLFINMMIPLVSGGLFCMIMVHHKHVGMIAPAMLIFYGLALINSSKYTFEDIRYLGLIEIGLGLLAAYFIGYGLLFWAIGFGVMHIVYGVVMYFKYER